MLSPGKSDYSLNIINAGIFWIVKDEYISTLEEILFQKINLLNTGNLSPYENLLTAMKSPAIKVGIIDPEGF